MAAYARPIFFKKSDSWKKRGCFGRDGRPNCPESSCLTESLPAWAGSFCRSGVFSIFKQGLDTVWMPAAGRMDTTQRYAAVQGMPLPEQFYVKMF